MKTRRYFGENLTLAEWVRVGLRVLDEIDAAAKTEPMRRSRCASVSAIRSLRCTTFAGWSTGE